MSETTDGQLGADDLIDAAGEIQWPPSEWSMPLRKPLVTADGATITHLHLREPTMDEFEQIMEHPEKTRRRKSVSLIAGLLMGEVAKIGVGDVVRAEAYLTSFFDIGQVIGAGSEPS